MELRRQEKNLQRYEIHAKGDQYVFIGMAGTQKAISWGVGKRNAESTTDFLHDLRTRLSASRRFQWTNSIPTA